MTEGQKAVVTTKYTGGLWQSFVGDEPLTNGSFKRRYDAEKVAARHAENNGLIHRVFTTQGTVKKEVDYGEPGKRGGDNGLLGGFGELIANITGGILSIFGRS